MSASEEARAGLEEARRLRGSGQPLHARSVLVRGLALWPDDAGFNRELGSLLLELGELEQAQHVLRRSTVLEPEAAEPWVMLATVFHRTGRPAEERGALEEARRRSASAAPTVEEGVAAMRAGQPGLAAELLRAALAHEAGNEGGWLALGSVLEMLEDHSGSVAALAEGAERLPASVRLHEELASRAERAGQLEVARRAATAALRLDGGSAVALRVLGALELRAGAAGAAEGLLRLAIQRLSGGPELRAAQRLLGQALDQLGRCEEAFEAFSAARLRDVPADRRALAERFEGFVREGMGLTAEEVARWPSGVSVSASVGERRTPAFIVGFPRSGTTLLERLLGAHPEVAITDELPTLENAAYAVMRRRPGSLWGALAGPDDEALRAGLEAYWSLIRRRMKPAPEATRFVLDRAPSQLPYLPVARRLFDGPRVLMCLRDPRDVVLSCFMMLDNRPTSAVQYATLESAARHYALRLDLWLRFREVLGLRWMEVRYEDVVRDAGGVCRDVLEFLGLEWHGAIEAAVAKGAGGPVRSQSFRQVAQPVYTRAVERWRRYQKHFGGALEVLEPYALRFGYASGV
ncbi:MAG: sulfotransferase [Planctomycetota bacterium]|nr:sulfotransferase [Planctomycetota bacterium]